TNPCLQPLAVCSFAGMARSYKFVFATFGCVFVRGRGPLLQIRVCNLWLCVRSRAWPAPTGVYRYSCRSRPCRRIYPSLYRLPHRSSFQLPTIGYPWPIILHLGCGIDHKRLLADMARTYKSVFATFGCVFVRGRGPLLQACIAILVGAGHAGEYIPAYTV